MIEHEEIDVPAPSAAPAIIFACVFAGPPSASLALLGGMGSAMQNTFSVLTFPAMAIFGWCLGGSVGGVIALLCGLHLPRGFVCLFGAAIGSIGGMFLCGMFTSAGLMIENRILSDAIALVLVSLGGLAGVAGKRFLAFGARSRTWARYSGGVFMLLGAERGYSLLPPDLQTEFHYFGPQALVYGCIVGFLGAMLAALAGAIGAHASKGWRISIRFKR
jgi:hypothetical protein